MTSHHIAIDLGSSNGRVFLGRFKGHEPELVEAHRFANAPIFQHGHWRWDWPFLRSEIHAGLRKAAELAGHGKIVSIGCNSWAQDFILLDAGGRALENPICYRDELTSGMPHSFAGIISPAELVKRTGCSSSPITALCKLKALREKKPDLLKKAKVMLHMADMIHFDLCGEAKTDWTLATASQLFNIADQAWDLELLSRLDIPTHFLPPVIMQPEVIGITRPDSSPHPALNGVPVISTAHHDTACATACLRPLKPGSFFICLGSYAMPGCVLSSAQRPAGADFEKNSLIGIAGRQWALFGSCAGLWIIQECKRIWEKGGMQIEYDRLARLAEQSPYQGIIDLSHPRFSKPDDMIAEIRNACRAAGLAKPGEPGDVAKLVLDSLAAGAEQAVRNLEKSAGALCRVLFLIGGGGRNQYLVRQISGRIGRKVKPPVASLPAEGDANSDQDHNASWRRRVIVGPAEATAAGNIILQHEVTGKC